MSGTTNLRELLQGMSPELDNTSTYVFLTVRSSLLKREDVIAYLKDTILVHAVSYIQEAEGATIIVSDAYYQNAVASKPLLSSDVPACLRAEWEELAAVAPVPRMSRITLRIHSSLAAVGLTAAFSQALTAAGISCNVVAAYYHDHIFVPVECVDRAMTVLRELSSSATV